MLESPGLNQTATITMPQPPPTATATRNYKTETKSTLLKAPSHHGRITESRPLPLHHSGMHGSISHHALDRKNCIVRKDQSAIAELPLRQTLVAATQRRHEKVPVSSRRRPSLPVHCQPLQSSHHSKSMMGHEYIFLYYNSLTRFVIDWILWIEEHLDSSFHHSLCVW